MKKNYLNKKRKLEIVAQTSDSRLQTSVTGITLVALVITVIILLILAGVAINMITGGDGLIAKTNNAVIKYNEAARSEAEIVNSLIKEYLSGNTSGSGEEQAPVPDFTEANVEIDTTSITSLPATVNVTVKNYNEEDYAKSNLKYSIGVIEGYSISTADGIIERTLEGGKKSEETFAVTIEETSDEKELEIKLLFNVLEPNKTTISKSILFLDKFVFECTENYQTFTVPTTGTYKIECWGAQGGSYGRTGGKGAYTSGEISLTKNEKIYVYVGPVGDASQTVKFNGGGAAGSAYNARSGGSATDIRLHITEDGSWNDFESLKSRIMVAGAGGGSDRHASGCDGGYGGALTGGNGLSHRSAGTASYTLAKGGTQTSGGDGGYGATTTSKVTARGSFGIGGNPASAHGGGGGAGYYGGGHGDFNTSHVGSGAGGSSFISGYEGCDAIDKDSTADNIIHTGQSNHYSGYVFTNATMIAGNASMPTHDGTSTMTGNSGDGYAKISFLGR